MPVTIQQILNHLRISNLAHRLIIKEDLLPAPDGLSNLVNETEEGINDMCVVYNRAEDPAGRFKVSRTTIERLVSLMYWVKDQERIGAVMRFATGTTQGEILAEVSDATVRER